MDTICGAIDERIGVDSSLSVYDGRLGWMRDWNVRVHNVQGVDLENLRAEAYQSGYSLLTRDIIASQAQFLGDDQSGKLYVLRFSLPGARDITYFIDKSTFLPVKTERLNEDNVLTTYFDDWRTVQGLRVPFNLRRSTGDAKYDTTIAGQRWFENF